MQSEGRRVSKDDHRDPFSYKPESGSLSES